jgi:hypothetical protein
MMMRMSGRVLDAFLAAAIVFASGTLSSTVAAEWGTLKARFAFDGAVPKRQKLLLNKDEDVCSKDHPHDEDLIVNPENRGIQNVVVWLELKRGESLPAIHPSYAESESAKVRLTNLSCRFSPRVTLLRTSQTLVLGNDDPIAHSTVAFLTYNQPFNYGIAPGTVEGTKLQLEKAENRPAQISCPIHSWMKAFLLVQDHPYMAVSDRDGRIEIRDIPQGEWTFRFWQEKAGYLTAISASGQKFEDKKGRYLLTIKGGETTDIGQTRMATVDFE